MQTERQELLVQGSYDGQNWQSYQFKYKPDALSKKPEIIIPHQPRLDWMVWFVPPQFESLMAWFDSFMYRLSLNQKEVTDLLAFNPFENKAPPRYLRVLAYDYRFSTPEEKEKTGFWWQAKFLGEFPNVNPRYP
jgi:hypothetical protein